MTQLVETRKNVQVLLDESVPSFSFRHPEQRNKMFIGLFINSC